MFAHGSGVVYVLFALGISVLGVAAAGFVLNRTPLKPPFDFGAVDALIGIVYGILLAILVLFAAGHYQNAMDHSDQEATALNDIYKAAGPLPAPARNAIRHNVICYAREKIELEWPLLRTSTGRGSPAVFARTRELGSLIEQAAAQHPTNLIISTLFNANLQRGTARQLVLDDSRPELPGPLWFVVILGIGIVVFLLSLRYWEEKAHLAAALVTSLLLLIAMVGAIAELDRPFASLIGLQPRSMEAVLTSVVESSSGGQVALAPCNDVVR